jgi:hypothetical protein
MTAVDIVGTGGDGADTVNISTGATNPRRSRCLIEIISVPTL